jgi:hypothetical protein
MVEVELRDSTRDWNLECIPQPISNPEIKVDCVSVYVQVGRKDTRAKIKDQRNLVTRRLPRRKLLTRNGV